MYYLLPSSGFTPASQEDGHSSGRLVLRSILTTVKDPSFLCQGWMPLRNQQEIIPAARKEPRSKVPLTQTVFKCGLFPLFAARHRGIGGAWVGWQFLPSLRTFSFSSSIALLTGSRDRRICLPASFPKHGSVGGCQMPSLWGGVWISPAQS